MRKTFWLAAVAMTAACSPTKDLALAEKEIGVFHQKLDQGQFQAIYDASTPSLKSEASPANFLPLFAAIRGKLGTFKSGKIAGFNDTTGTSGHVISIAYAAVYEHGTAQEDFVYQIKDGKAALAGYHVSSDALIVR